MELVWTFEMSFTEYQERKIFSSRDITQVSCGDSSISIFFLCLCGLKSPDSISSPTAYLLYLTVVPLGLSNLPVFFTGTILIRLALLSSLVGSSFFKLYNLPSASFCGGKMALLISNFAFYHLSTFAVALTIF